MEDGDSSVGSAAGLEISTGGKQRMRWTPELRASFEQAVNQLGGPDRATPKGILKTMSIPGVTIGHVKSYLQKYRMLKFAPESFERSRHESRMLSEVMPDFHATSRVQIHKALQLHMEAQEKPYLDAVQRLLKIKIQLQRNYLDKITEGVIDFSSECSRTKRPFTLPLPSLFGVSNSADLWKQNSDSEFMIAETNSSSRCFEAPPKRPRVDKDVYY